MFLFDTSLHVFIDSFSGYLGFPVLEFENADVLV